MRIAEIRRESSAGRERVVADVAWEDSDRPSRRIFFEVPAEFGGDLSTESESFAIGCAIPAMSHGERRLKIEGTLCPRVRDGLFAISSLLRSWYGPGVSAPTIEPSGGFHPKSAAERPRSALFLSGGIDSLYSLVSNRVDFPPDHPAFFRDALLVRGFSFFPPDTLQAEDAWRRASAAVDSLAAAQSVVPIRIVTNLREFEPDFMLFASRYFGVMLAAAAHALARRVTTVAIAADLDIAHVFPWGSHPLLYPLAGSSAVEVVESGGERTRLEKVRFLARRPEVFAGVTVCAEGPLPGGVLNCGRCEKCVRTLLAMMIAGIPESARGAFAVRSVRADAIERLQACATPSIPYFWTEIVGGLEETGRGELAAAGRRLLERCRRTAEWHAESGWRGSARRMDRRYLRGALLGASRMIRSLPGRVRSFPR
jgi:hypothetical protein